METTKEDGYTMQSTKFKDIHILNIIKVFTEENVKVVLDFIKNKRIESSIKETHSKNW